MGGVERISAQLRRERIFNSPFQLYVLGNLLPGVDPSGITSRYLLEALSAWKPDATLLNHVEISYLSAVKAHSDAGRFISGARFVLSNRRSEDLFAGQVRSHIIAGNDLVFGFTYGDTGKDILLPFGPDLKNRLASVIAANRQLRPVLLFSGSDEQLREIQESGLFATIISSNTTPRDKEAGKAERDDESLLTHPGGKGVVMVPWGGQGILRGGRMLAAKPPTIGSLMNIGGGLPAAAEHCNRTLVGGKMPDDCTDPAAPALFSTTLVTWLMPDSQGEHDLGDLISRYSSAVKSNFEAVSRDRVKQLASSVFAGAQTCTGCHSKAAESYRLSRHASAMQTLVTKGREHNPYCVECHVLGASVPGGFVSLKDSPGFANVQCENCHGPAKDHVKNPQAVKPAKITGEVCSKCHNSQHSPGFDFPKYWLKIAH